VPGWVKWIKKGISVHGHKRDATCDETAEHEGKDCRDMEGSCHSLCRMIKVLLASFKCPDKIVSIQPLIFFAFIALAKAAWFLWHLLPIQLRFKAGVNLFCLTFLFRDLESVIQHLQLNRI
jgi:hypothetical protein